jgi:hypothetical protein
VTNRANVHVRLVAFEFLFAHGVSSLCPVALSVPDDAVSDV